MPIKLRSTRGALRCATFLPEKGCQRRESPNLPRSLQLIHPFEVAAPSARDLPSLGMAPIATRNRALSIICHTSTHFPRSKRCSNTPGEDDEIVGSGVSHVFAFMRPIKRIPVRHFFEVAENILTIDSPVGKSQQNLLEMLSQPSHARVSRCRTRDAQPLCRKAPDNLPHPSRCSAPRQLE